MRHNIDISNAMSIKLDNILDELPEMPKFQSGIRRAPKRHFSLSKNDTILAIKNALRYIPEKWHLILAPEFLDELLTNGRVYGYRFRPAGRIKGLSIDSPTIMRYCIHDHFVHQFQQNIYYRKVGKLFQLNIS